MRMLAKNRPNLAPLAVHLATLEDGSTVVVKVRRPGIRPTIEADLRWLMRLADLVELENPEMRNFHPKAIVRQFEQSLRRELDFATESRSVERIARNFEGYTEIETDPAAIATSGTAERPTTPIIIPRVYWQWTGERVCVQEFIDGIPGRNLAAADRAGLNRKALARRGSHAATQWGQTRLICKPVNRVYPHQCTLVDASCRSKAWAFSNAVAECLPNMSGNNGVSYGANFQAEADCWSCRLDNCRLYRCSHWWRRVYSGRSVLYPARPS